MDIRNKIGVSFPIEDADRVVRTIADIQEGKILDSVSVSQIVEQYVYKVGSHGAAGADYIIRKIGERRAGNRKDGSVRDT